MVLVGKRDQSSMLELQGRKVHNTELLVKGIFIVNLNINLPHFTFMLISYLKTATRNNIVLHYKCNLITCVSSIKCKYCF